MAQGKNVVVAMLVSLVVGAVSGAGTSMYLLTSDVLDLNAETESVVVSEVYTEESKLISAYETASPAVVSIIAMQDLTAYYNQYFWGPLDYYYQSYDVAGEENLQEVGGGTGFLINADGLAITNKHVIEDQSLQYVAYTSDGLQFDVEILDIDENNDLAIFKLVASEEDEGYAMIGKFPYLQFGDSDAIKVGQMVMAIGNAFAEYDNTTTAGIVSATGREIIASDSFGRATSELDGLIQTDAAINPGNSGGPLVDLSGKVIGINTAVDADAEGIGFAIPVNDIVQIVNAYNQYGYIAYPYLGVMYVMVNAEADQRLDLGVDYGAALVGDPASGEPAVVAGSPADDAGLQARDIILEIDGVVIDEDNQLNDVLYTHSIGDEVTLKVWRDGKAIEVKVTLGQTK